MGTWPSSHDLLNLEFCHHQKLVVIIIILLFLLISVGKFMRLLLICQIFCRFFYNYFLYHIYISRTYKFSLLPLPTNLELAN